MHNMASREFQDLLHFVANQEVGSGVDNDSAARQNCHNDIRIRQLVVVRYKHILGSMHCAHINSVSPSAIQKQANF